MSESVQHTTLVMGPSVGSGKSMGTALLLAFFFGPFGLLYATVTGGLIMLAIDLVVAIFTLGFGLLLTWPIPIIWAAVAVNKHRRQQTELAMQLSGSGSPTSVSKNTSDPTTDQT